MRQRSGTRRTNEREERQKEHQHSFITRSRKRPEKLVAAAAAAAKVQMTTNNGREVYHEGWLIKSPPTKRIWRARWRRRWFTLKQGELPGQFFLEYYTDRKCRKLKGIIDLDQCEQVDAGLRLDRQKEKYAHMFDVKTPTRTYYLAADTEEDMRGWVNCICQVCNLQETQTVEEERPY